MSSGESPAPIEQLESMERLLFYRDVALVIIGLMAVLYIPVLLSIWVFW